MIDDTIKAGKEVAVDQVLKYRDGGGRVHAEPIDSSLSTNGYIVEMQRIQSLLHVFHEGAQVRDLWIEDRDGTQIAQICRDGELVQPQ